MLSGLKFIPRDHIDTEKDETSKDSKKKTRKSVHRKEKLGRKKKHSRCSSSDDDGLEKIKSGSKKKKWFDSDEEMSSSSEGSGTQSDSSELKGDRKRRRSKKREMRSRDDSLHTENKRKLKKKTKSRRNDYSSESESTSGSENERSNEKGSHHREGVNNVREEMGLEWMLPPKESKNKISSKSFPIESEEASAEEVKKDNPRELNPYLKDNGSGYPEESAERRALDKRLLSNAVIGDGGASWRLKALKRAQEQAVREGRKLEEVVEERWDSMGHLAASVASRGVAPTHSHLHAIKHRRKGLMKEEQTKLDEENDNTERGFGEKSMKDIHPRHPKMRMPKIHDSLSWGKRGSKKMSAEDTALVSAAMSSLNKFSNDGNFMAQFVSEEKSGDPSNSSKSEVITELNSVEIAAGENNDAETLKPTMSANQLAAKALQLRMKGKHEEAEKLMKEAENIRERQNVGTESRQRSESSRPQLDGTTSRFIMHDVSTRQKNKEEDADLHLAQKIMQNHRFSVSSQADEEYDYDDGPRRKTRKKGGDGGRKSSEITNSVNRFMTQQDRCQFCFESRTRPKHLVIAIANFTYLSLPHQQPVVPGHCCILTLQHESSTRSVDDNVWDEIRNFKKCLIMMFAKQEKDVLFIETVMDLARQRRHCLVECIPVPQDIAKQAPVYFKKAIDEAENEWSQHNAKKLIDTSEKGLRGSIPKNFPYFHVEFGVKRGFVHVIDDEKEFKSSFGLNVVRGMLQLPAEDMHRRRRQESLENQKQAAATFARDWVPFDWTKQLD